jgi:hypothetical protein
MKKDPIREILVGIDRFDFWVNYTYQYWVGETTLKFPALVKRQIHILRWFYRLMMMVFQLQLILICLYPVGQEREVTVLQTGQTPIHGVRPPQIL